MSLVGSLEDLGLGDILQIVSLARKSGLLFLRAESGDGRIVFESGLVRAAYVKTEPETLAGLLAAGGFAEAETVERIVAQCQENGSSRDECLTTVAEQVGRSSEEIQSLCREHVERAVFEMFRWNAGEFSFDVSTDLETRSGELALAVGINAQYLTMEATRLGDEGDLGDSAAAPDFAFSGEDAAGGDPFAEDFAFSGEDSADGAAPADALVGEDDVVSVDGADEPDADPVGPEDVVAMAAVQAAEAAGPGDASDDEDTGPLDVAQRFELDDEAPAAPAAPTSREPTQATSVPLVIVDVELMALEWLKARLSPLFTRIHIFQHSEGGVARIRQYLGRGIVPVVLVSGQVPADSLTGAQEAGELVRRLRAQAPRMPILAMFDSDEEGLPQGLDAADAVLKRPSQRLLADARRSAETERLADELRRALAPWCLVDADGESDANAAKERRERAVAAVLRDPESQGEVLEHVLDFASERFNRVALFMVRDEEAVGIAQRRLVEAGGPTPKQFVDVRIPLRGPAWFRDAIDAPEGRIAAPTDPGDEDLAAQLGSALAPEAYVGAIRSGGHLAALIYADNLPGGAACGDAGGMDAVLAEAGMALERTLRARAESSGEG